MLWDRRQLSDGMDRRKDSMVNGNSNLLHPDVVMLHMLDLKVSLHKMMLQTLSTALSIPEADI